MTDNDGTSPSESSSRGTPTIGSNTAASASTSKSLIYLQAHHSGIQEVCCSTCSKAICFVDDPSILDAVATDTLIAQVAARKYQGDPSANNFYKGIRNQVNPEPIDVDAIDSPAPAPAITDVKSLAPTDDSKPKAKDTTKDAAPATPSSGTTTNSSGSNTGSSGTSTVANTTTTVPTPPAVGRSMTIPIPPGPFTPEQIEAMCKNPTFISQLNEALNGPTTSSSTPSTPTVDSSLAPTLAVVAPAPAPVVLAPAPAPGVAALPGGLPPVAPALRRRHLKITTDAPIWTLDVNRGYPDANVKFKRNLASWMDRLGDQQPNETRPHRDARHLNSGIDHSIRASRSPVAAFIAVRVLQEEVAKFNKKYDGWNSAEQTILGRVVLRIKQDTSTPNRVNNLDIEEMPTPV